MDQYGYFDGARVQRLVQKIEAGRAVGEKDSMALIAVLSTHLLHHRFVETFNPTDEAIRADRTADSPVYSL